MAHRDPFQNTPDVSAYVARPATEEALDSLLAAVRSGEQLVALVGPDGIGKTLLLHVLADRARDEMQLVRVPVPSLPPEGLFGWVLATIGVSAGKDPRGRLLDETRKADAAGCPLLVAIDDASALPEESAEALQKLHAETAPALRVVLAFGTDDASELRLSQFGASISTVRLEQPMSSAETALYVHSCLLQGDVDGCEAVRFDPEAISQLHDHSGGLPGQVNELAEVLLRPEETARAHEIAGELRPESLAFALLSDAETEHRVSDWSDEELARFVASRGPNEQPESAQAEPQPSLELGTPYAQPEQQRGTAPVATASALLSREARNSPLPELPELPEPRSFGLGARILDALSEESATATDPAPQAPERSDEFVELATPSTVASVERVRDALRLPEPEAQIEVPISTSPAPPPRANPVAERILESLRNPSPPAAASQRSEEADALPSSGGSSEADAAFADPASRILAALEVADASRPAGSVIESDLTGATAEAEELAHEFAEEASLEPAFAGDSLFATDEPPTPEATAESFDQASALLPYVPAPAVEAPAPVAPESFPQPIPQSFSEDSVLLRDPPAPTASSGDRSAASGSLPPLTLSDLSSGSRSLRSLGVFDGGSDRIEVSRPAPAGLGASESMEDLAGEITRDAHRKRGLRTETFALALGIVLFAGGGLVYWASTPKTIVRPPTIQVPDSPYVAEAPVDEQGIASDLPAEALAQSSPAEPKTAPRVAAAAQVAPPVQQEMTFWPPLETAEVEPAPQVAAATQAPAESVAASTASTSPEAPAAEVAAPEPVIAATPAPIAIAQAAPDAAEAELVAEVLTQVPAPVQVPEATEVAETETAEPIEPIELAELAEAPTAQPIEVTESLDVAGVLEIAEPTVASSAGALAGLRPPAAIAVPNVAERVLPVTIRAVPGSSIEIDGIARGASPLFGLLLSEGTHRVVATAADGTRDEQLFEVDDQNLEVTFDSPASR